MKLEHSFEVTAPLERVWAKLIDVEQVAPCLPGAEITEADDDGTYHGTFSVRLGPTTAAYRGQLAMDEVDEAGHRVVMQASGQDKRGQGSAKATIVSTMSEHEGVTKVEVETDFMITGRLARFGRGGMIQDVSNRLLRDFSDCLQKSIEGPAPADSAAASPSTEPSASSGGEPAASPGGEPSALGAGPPAASPPAPPAGKPVRGFSLMMGVLWDRIRRLFRRER
jgi:carbon monoxide dehydrogenase subunit G